MEEELKYIKSLKRWNLFFMVLSSALIGVFLFEIYKNGPGLFNILFLVFNCWSAYNQSKRDKNYNEMIWFIKKTNKNDKHK